jgi:hypothetical protein
MALALQAAEADLGFEVNRFTFRWLFLSHPEALPVRHPQDFSAFGTEIDIALPKETLQFPAPDLRQFFGAMRAYRIHIILFFDWQHARMLLFLSTSILQLIRGKFKESSASVNPGRTDDPVSSKKMSTL